MLASNLTPVQRKSHGSSESVAERFSLSDERMRPAKTASRTENKTSNVDQSIGDHAAGEPVPKEGVNEKLTKEKARIVEALLTDVIDMEDVNAMSGSWRVTILGDQELVETEDAGLEKWLQLNFTDGEDIPEPLQDLPIIVSPQPVLDVVVAEAMPLLTGGEMSGQAGVVSLLGEQASGGDAQILTPIPEQTSEFVSSATSSTSNFVSTDGGINNIGTAGAEQLPSGGTLPIGPTSTPQEMVISAMVQQVNTTEQGEHSTLVVQLHPAELGQVTLQLEWDRDSLNAKILASDSAAMDLLQQHKPQLVAALAENGIDFDSLEVGYENADQQQMNDQSKRGRPVQLSFSSDEKAAGQPVVSTDLASGINVIV